jgi:predicted MFS family arabinose efflux permease
MPELAGEDEALVSRANALFQVATQGTTIFGPVLAGVLIGATSAPTVLVADAASFLASGVIVATLVRAGERVEAEPSAHGVLAGLRFVLREPLLGPLVLAAIAMSLAHQALSGMLPVLAFERYGRATSAGVVFAADGVGSVLGSLLVIGLAGRVPTARLLRVAVAVMAAALWPLPFALPLAAIAASMFVFGFGSMLFVPPLVSVITLRSPASLRGKVMTSYVTVMMLAGPAGIALAGPSVQAFGLEPVFLGVATVFAVGAVGVSVVVRGASRSSPTPDPRCRSARGHRAVRRRGSCPPAHPRPTRPGTP